MTEKSTPKINYPSGNKHPRNKLSTGRHSEFIQNLKKRIDASAMDRVKKMELNSIIEEVTARSIALDTDSYINRMLVERIKALDPQIVHYETDLYSTQSKLSELESSIQFHKKVLTDLKNEYLDCTDLERQKQILEEIDKREDAIKKHQLMYQKYVETRNKIRKELDKKDYMDKSQELKEKEMEKNVINVQDINMESE